ncbi:hypothetical protein Cdeb_03123 [Caldibacillus debilis GB1]|uniref:Uncharacterized protein n=1 Tax=Caldibacillus debilis GB1 TaxID=1339248 RepID=A0A420VG14_9BACI|nr:hypothetical protein Cdeb_03123 [Caldibacillus debilis GB1]
MPVSAEDGRVLAGPERESAVFEDGLKRKYDLWLEEIFSLLPEDVQRNFGNRWMIGSCTSRSSFSRPVSKRKRSGR